MHCSKRVPVFAVSDELPYGTSMPGAGAVHHTKKRRRPSSASAKLRRSRIRPSSQIAMDCVGCSSRAVTERPDLTAQGYRRLRFRDCDQQFNERSDSVLKSRVAAERHHSVRGVLPAGLQADTAGPERVHAVALDTALDAALVRAGTLTRPTSRFMAAGATCIGRSIATGISSTRCCASTSTMSWCWARNTFAICWRITSPITIGFARILRSTGMLRSSDLRRQ